MLWLTENIGILRLEKISIPLENAWLLCPTENVWIVIINAIDMNGSEENHHMIPSMAIDLGSGTLIVKTFLVWVKHQ